LRLQLKAVEEKRFHPLGSDREVASDFQLIVGTNRDLRREVAAGRFRDDLFARINLWAYTLPGLAQRVEDIEPNVEYLLARSTADTGRVVRFNVEAKARYLRFAQSDEALWSGNFRDLSASVTRLSTLAEGGRINTALVEAELQRLRWLWQRTAPVEKAVPAQPVDMQGMDLFDRLQLDAVLGVCRQCKSLSEAGRTLFDQSRSQRSVVNDADRLRKYLQKWGLAWEQVGG
jgi:transcriptional regulatory protein RtcR